MMKRVLLFLSLFPLLLFSQQQENYINGIVLNQSNDPLPFASIQFVGTNDGTISNEDGEFVIDRRKLLNDTLMVHFMGYQSKLFIIEGSTSDLSIVLDQAVNNISEIVVVGDKESYAMGLIKNLIRKYRAQDKTQQSKAFINLYSQMEQPLEIFEAFYNATLSPEAGVQKLELKNGRAGLITQDNFAFVSLNTTDLLCDFSPFQKNQTQKLPLIPSNLGLMSIKSRFSLSIDYIIDNGEEQTAVVSFNPKHEDGIYFSGKYYIDIGENRLQKLSMEIKNTQKDFLRSIQEDVNIDSLDILLDLNYIPGSTQLESMVFRYRFLPSNRPGEYISSKALLAFYDYDKPFELPVSHTIKLDYDYHRILSYPYNDIFWKNNYYIPASQNRTDFTEFFKTNGYLINHDSLTVQSPYIESPYVSWSADKRLTWGDIQYEKPISFKEMEDGYMIIHYQADRGYNLYGHLFLDFELDGDDVFYYSRASIDRGKSYLTELPRNIFVLLYLNMYFDLFEIHRRALMEELNKQKSADRMLISRLYEKELEALKWELETLRKDTQQGFKPEGLIKWNKLINNELGVDNLKKFGMSEEELFEWQ